MVARPQPPLRLLPSRVGPPGAWSSTLGWGCDPVRLAGGESPVLVDVAEEAAVEQVEAVEVVGVVVAVTTVLQGIHLPVPRLEDKHPK